MADLQEKQRVAEQEKTSLDLAVGECGGMAVGECGGVAVAVYGGVAVGECGGVAVGECGGVAGVEMGRLRWVYGHGKDEWRGKCVCPSPSPSCAGAVQS